MFLLFAVALETLLLPPRPEAELTYRLKVRCAHLIAKTHDARARVAAEVSKLYGVRSKVVHKGFEPVTEEELQAIRAITVRSIVACLRKSEIRKMTSETQLDNWFEARVLR